jgi:hypothetical protein
MVIERRVGSQVVRADCAPAYVRAADHVLDEFEKLARSGTPLRPGTQIRFGWTLLRLADDGNGLLVTEPDFVSWPREAWSRTIDRSLEVLAAQVRLLRRLGVDGEDAYFDQFLIGAPGALARPGVFLRRDDSIAAEDSGWRLGSVEDPEALAREEQLERVAAAHLVGLRPALLQALTLPRGFIAVFSGESIEQVYDAGGRELGPGPDAPTPAVEH